MFEGKPNAPCYKCEKRHYKCHADCKPYKDFAEMEAYYNSEVHKYNVSWYENKKRKRWRWRTKNVH